MLVSETERIKRIHTRGVREQKVTTTKQQNVKLILCFVKLLWMWAPAHAIYFASYEFFKEQFGGNKSCAGHNPIPTGSAGILATVNTFLFFFLYLCIGFRQAFTFVSLFIFIQLKNSLLLLKRQILLHVVVEWCGVGPNGRRKTKTIIKSQTLPRNNWLSSYSVKSGGFSCTVCWLHDYSHHECSIQFYLFCHVWIIT